MPFSFCKYLHLALVAYLFAGCEQSVAESFSADLPFDYASASSELFQGRIVRIGVEVRYAKHDAAAFYSANCTTVSYALNGGFAFVRFVTTMLDCKRDLKSTEERNLTSVASLPAFKKVIAEVVVIKSAENGVPIG